MPAYGNCIVLLLEKQVGDFRNGFPVYGRLFRFYLPAEYPWAMDVVC